MHRKSRSAAADKRKRFTRTIWTTIFPLFQCVAFIDRRGHSTPFNPWAVRVRKTATYLESVK